MEPRMLRCGHFSRAIHSHQCTMHAIGYTRGTFIWPHRHTRLGKQRGKVISRIVYQGQSFSILRKILNALGQITASSAAIAIDNVVLYYNHSNLTFKDYLTFTLILLLLSKYVVNPCLAAYNRSESPFLRALTTFLRDDKVLWLRFKLKKGERPIHSTWTSRRFCAQDSSIQPSAPEHCCKRYAQCSSTSILRHYLNCYHTATAAYQLPWHHRPSS